MPGLVDAGGPLVLDPNGSTNLTNATIPTPDDPAWYLVEGPGVATQGALENPTPDFFLKELVTAGGPGDAIFDKIHVIPRERDLGAVISDQEFTVEVWNAAKAAARILDEITITGASGVSIVSPPAFPDHWPATRSELFTVAVDENGDAILDTYVTWVFLGISTEGTDLHILGFRLVPVMFEPNMDQPIRERFGFITDLLVAFNAMEQRIQLRAVPVGSIGFTVLHLDRREAQMANAVLYGNQARTLGIPRWQFQTPSTAAAVIDDTKVFCDTTSLPFVAGGLVFLWASPLNWEVQTIDTVDVDGVNLTLGLKKNWPEGTLVIPMVLGRLSPEETFTWHTLEKGEQALEFQVDGFTP